MKSDKYDKIFEQNKKWIESQNKKDRSFFKESYKEQNPDFLYILAVQTAEYLQI